MRNMKKLGALQFIAENRKLAFVSGRYCEKETESDDIL